MHDDMIITGGNDGSRAGMILRSFHSRSPFEAGEAVHRIQNKPWILGMIELEYPTMNGQMCWGVDNAAGTGSRPRVLLSRSP